MLFTIFHKEFLLIESLSIADVGDIFTIGVSARLITVCRVVDLAVGCCEAVVILRDETRPVVALCIVPVYSTLVRRFVVITVGIADVFRVD